MSELSEARKAYGRYSKRHPVPMSFKCWMYFRTQGAKGGKLSKNDKVKAGKLGALVRWGKR